MAAAYVVRQLSCERIAMKMFRYRAPSVRTVLGVTALKRKAKRELGVSQVQAWTKPSRINQRAKRKIGLYSPAVRVIRQTSKGRVPTFLGLFGRTRH